MMTADLQPNQQPFSAQQLRESLERLASGVQMFQQYALVVERERAPGDSSSGNPTLDEKIHNTLNEMYEHARYILDQPLVKFQGTIADIQSAANLVLVLLPMVEDKLHAGVTVENLRQVAGLIEAVAAQLDSSASNVRQLAVILDDESQSIAIAFDDFKNALALYENSQGLNDKTKSFTLQVKSIQSEIANALDNMIAGGEAIGDGAKVFFSSGISAVAKLLTEEPSMDGGMSKNEPGADKTAIENDSSSPAKNDKNAANQDSQQVSASHAGFISKAKNEISKGAITIGRAKASLTAQHQQLESLYREMAKQGTWFAINMIFAERCTLLVRSVKNAAKAAGRVSESWNNVARTIRAYASEVERLTDENSNLAISAAHEGKASWMQLRERANEFAMVFAAGTARIRPGGALARND